MTDEIEAPFTDEQQAALTAYQRSGRMHPFTCPAHSDTALVARSSWHCAVEGCGYTQQWAHAFMTDPMWGAGLEVQP